ncbi:MAG: DUF1598 domain-containing protein [Planctomycetaceae bacterium]
MRRIETRWGQARRRGNTSTLLAGGLGLTVVVGAFWLFRQTTAPTVPAAAPPVVAVPAAPAAAVAKPVAVLAATPATPAPEQSPVQLTLGQQVAAHLQAGEFGLAFDLASSTNNPAEQASLLRQVARAQADAGDAAAAKRTLAKLPLGFDDEPGNASELQITLGGGMSADPTELINLIVTQTGSEADGPWVTTHGSGSEDPAFFSSGVRVDAKGVLALAANSDRDGRLASVSLRARDAALNDDMSRPAEMRMVSLTRLERAIADRLAAGKPVVESMRQLAGLAEVRYVFLYPEQHEIVLAGPAEGWRYNEQGRAVGANTGRPTLQLDDLVTVMRTFSRDGMNIFGCSIDPKPENLQALKDFVNASQARGPLANGQAGRWAKQLQDKLGMQTVSVFGVPADSRVARVIVEADYRMKLIGIGKLDAGSQIPDYFALLSRHPEQASGRIDGLRWWLTLQCQEVLNSADRDAYELRGTAVKCLSENEFLNNQGERVHTGDAEPTNRLFASNFTEHYADLAQREPIFADMDGVFNLALVAALIQHDGLDRQAGWDRGTFRIGGQYLTARYPAAKEVETVANHRVFKGSEVVVQVAGGVKGDMVSLLENADARQVSPRLDGVAEKGQPVDLPANRWWWDAK